MLMNEAQNDIYEALKVILCFLRFHIRFKITIAKKAFVLSD